MRRGVARGGGIGCSGGGSNPQATMCFGANVVANENNNYAFSSTITLPPVTVAPMSNLTFDWSGLTKDFLGPPAHTRPRISAWRS